MFMVIDNGFGTIQIFFISLNHQTKNNSFINKFKTPRKLETYCRNEYYINSNIDMDNNKAYISYNEFGYFWEIKTVEIPE